MSSISQSETLNRGDGIFSGGMRRATYHNAVTARDRDRLRQAVLEGLGWRLIRVWSTDWVRDREKQVKRILAAMECEEPAVSAGRTRVRAGTRHGRPSQGVEGNRVRIH